MALAIVYAALVDEVKSHLYNIFSHNKSSVVK